MQYTSCEEDGAAAASTARKEQTIMQTDFLIPAASFTVRQRFQAFTPAPSTAVNAGKTGFR
jgi:hypothetical protein